MADSAENYELFFLIVKFLREGACPAAADLLERELTDPGRGLLPPRLDWTGRPHHQTYTDLERQHPSVGPGHLASLAAWLTAQPRPGRLPGPRSLLSAPCPRPAPPRLLPALALLSNRALGLSRRARPHHREPSVYGTVYDKLGLQRRTLGHLSPVFCLLFDKTGRYVFTGADDLLVKMWGASNGRLYFTFRGASAEISDMAVSEDNRLLAAGSTDKIIRVWCLGTAAPVAVLSKHTGTITALHFCPSACSPRYLAATSGDGTVSFWRYQLKGKKRALFDPEPTRYHEKMRPGGAQMICAAFSPGGLFLATGSVDHHVRVYVMDGEHGPGKVLEQEAHTERVDSIQWANSPVLRFVSGSKDGTARLWRYRGGAWHSAVLRMTARDGRKVAFNKQKNCEEPLRVTMVNWVCDDSRVVTAVSDSSLCVWDPSSQALLQRLTGHRDEVYCLEPHPTLPDLLMSGAHDGYLIIWNIATNTTVFKHHNTVTSDNGTVQGNAAIYDAKWSPDQLHVAASDSHGHILFFSSSSSEARGDAYRRGPEEMFFHTDYRPLLRDAAHHVVDEQTQLAPHLLPPPFLVDIEGNPYPADIQRLVPGREHLSDKEALVPEVAEEVPAPRPLPEQRRSLDAAAAPVPDPPAPASNIDVLIAELAAGGGVVAPGAAAEPAVHSEHSYATPGPAGAAGTGRAAAGEARPGEPAPSSRQLQSSVWRKRSLIRTEEHMRPGADLAHRRALGVEERRFYKAETARRRHSSGLATVGHHEGVLGPVEKAAQKGRKTGRGRGTAASRATAAVRPEPAARPDSESEDEASDDDFRESSVTDSSLSESDLEEASGSSSASTVYSDWGDNNLTPPQRTAAASGRQGAAQPGQEEEEEEQEQRPGPSRYFRRKKYNFDPTQLEEIPPDYLPSPWLAEYVPKKSPYFPQMGDEVMYCKQGHLGYINLVKVRKAYKINSKEQAWLKRDDLRQVELVKVVGIKYDIRPPRLCCLKLAVRDPEDGEVSGKAFSIKYHDMNDVVDFLVLRHNYESALKVTWAAGDSYRCQIEDQWWHGSVIQVSPLDPKVPDSPFLSIRCMWDSGEEERLSPWDLEQIPDGEDMEGGEQRPVTRREIEKHLYRSSREEWRGLDHLSESKRISKSLAEVMELAASESFNYPVDLTLFPDYMLEVEYPMDFTLIKSRLDSLFYRRSTAVQFDVRYIATNAECYNQPKTDIVKYGRILTDLVLKIIQDPDLSDVTREYHRLVETFKWEDTQEASAGKARGKKGRRSQDSSKDSPNPKQWKHDCIEMLNQLFEDKDSIPFRTAVDEEEYEDYHRVVTTPMDMTQIRESLRVGEYDTPMELQKDVLLMFANSFTYNTDRKSEVLAMTKRLKERFLDTFQVVLTNWRKVNRRIGFLQKKNSGKSPVKTPSKKTPSKDQRKKKAVVQYKSDPSDDEEDSPVVKRKKPTKRRLDLDRFSSDSDRPRPKNKGKGKGKGKSSKAVVPKPAPPPPVQEESSEDDTPISRRTPQKKTINKNGVKGFRRHVPKYKEDSEEAEEEEEEEEEEEAVETPESSEEEDEAEEAVMTPSPRRIKSKKKLRESWEYEKVRPKRSAKAKIIEPEESDSEEEEAKKVPPKRRSGPEAVDPGEGPSQRPHRSSIEASRPRRQATEKALDKFQQKTSSEEEDSEEESAPPRPPPRPKPSAGSPTKPGRPRRQVLPVVASEGSEEEVVAAPRRRRPAPLPRSETGSEESNLEPVQGRGRRGTAALGVIISAADSSTDPRVVRELGAERRAREGGPAREQGGERRSTRPVVRPARLQDYSEEEGGRAGKGKKRKSRSLREEGEEEEARGRRREGVMSPKAKRSKGSAVNYRDDPEEEDEEESLSLRKAAKRKKRKDEEAATAAAAALATRRKSPKKSPQSSGSRRQRSRGEVATYEERSYDDEEDELNEEEDSEESLAADMAGEAAGGEESDGNYGRRRGMRPRRVMVAGGAARPQRSAGQGSRSSYREPSTDDDLPPRRRHRGRSGPGAAPGILGPRVAAPRESPRERIIPPSTSGSSSEDEEEEEEDEEEGGQGVSSRGRRRRPNPKLFL